jgi:uncharacterized DUF497 family protein
MRENQSWYVETASVLRHVNRMPRRYPHTMPLAAEPGLFDAVRSRGSQQRMCRSRRARWRRYVLSALYTLLVPRDAVRQLLATDVALDKLAARGISAEEVAQLPRNPHITVRNPRAAEPGKRVLLIGATDGGRLLTVVIERTADPATWLVITGWASTAAERNLLGRQR